MLPRNYMFNQSKQLCIPYIFIEKSTKNIYKKKCRPKYILDVTTNKPPWFVCVVHVEHVTNPV